MNTAAYLIPANPKLGLFTSCMVSLAAALCLAISSGYSYGFAILCLSAVPILLYKRPQLRLNRADKWLLGTLVMYVVVNVALNLYHHLPSSSYEQFSRYLFAIATILLLLAFPVRPHFWWLGLIVGTFAGGCLAIWQVWIADLPRADGHLNAIQFGDISILMGGLCLVGLGWGRRRGQYAKVWVLAFSVAALFGGLGSVLSGSRGGWLAVPVMLAVLYLGCRRYFSRRMLRFIVVLPLLLLLVLYVIPQTGMQGRVGLAFGELNEYLHGADLTSSIAIRLEMWRGGLQLVPEHWLLGWGKTEYIAPLQALMPTSTVARAVGQLGHLHNDVLDVLVKRGLVGLLALLAVYIVPLVLFIRNWRAMVLAQRSDTRTYALAGMLLVVSVFVFGLTQAFFRHNSGVTVYVFYLAVLWTMMRKHERSESPAILAAPQCSVSGSMDAQKA